MQLAQKGADTSREVDKPIQKMVNHSIIPALFYLSDGEPNLRNDNALTASHLANKTI